MLSCGIYKQNLQFFEQELCIQVKHSMEACVPKVHVNTSVHLHKLICNCICIYESISGGTEKRSLQPVRKLEEAVLTEDGTTYEHAVSGFQFWADSLLSLI